MKVTLFCVDAVPLRDEIRLDRFPVVIGRGHDVDVRLDDGWVSRVHCLIDQIDGTLIVRDLGSSHGTLVNGERVDESRLRPGDTISIGISTFQAKNQPQPAENNLPFVADTVDV